MTTTGNTWAIVLAGGEGSRLHGLTTTALGVAVPKQFCSLRGGHSLLREALKRAEAVAQPKCICTIVSQHHRHWWSRGLSAMPIANIVVQPRNCGTANGILLPLLYILARDPEARVVLLPSDHHVRDEQTLAVALQKATLELRTRGNQIVLIGILPEEADPDLGYIVPGRSEGVVSTVDRFVEKPNAPQARTLVQAGALWNAFIVVAGGKALLQRFVQRVPRIVAGMQTMVAENPFTADFSCVATDFYHHLPNLDFSRQILPGAESFLRVLQARRCGWSDLGTPKRLAETLRDLSLYRENADEDVSALNLAVQHQRFQQQAGNLR
jgi:mannose-1-phosphate guanylyltransferase